MSVIARGAKNAFRNSVRSFSIIVILAISLALALVMLLSMRTVQSRIDSVKSSIGNTVTIAPAGFSDFSQANNALTASQLDPVKALPHVTGMTETLTDRLFTIGSAQPSGLMSQDSNNQTNLKSAIKLTNNGNGGFSTGGGGKRLFISGVYSGNGQLPANFSPPVSIIGTNDPSQLNAEAGNAAKLISGQFFDGNKDSSNAMVSTDMANQNNLKVGSTFTAYGQTLTVVGIFDTGSRGANNSIVVPLPTEQRLSGQSGDITGAVATVDSLDNLASTTTAIKDALGSNADVQSSVDQASNALTPLENIKTISLYSLIGALIAGSVIIFLTMLMIVRERRREIGVLKAIGSSNAGIMTQFVVEALTLTVCGAIVGVIGGVLLSNPVLKLLVATSSTGPGGPGRFAGGRGFGGGIIRAFGGFQNLHAVVGYNILLYGLGAAIVIAILGSAIPSWFIAKIRPAEVMRAE